MAAVLTARQDEILNKVAVLCNAKNAPEVHFPNQCRVCNATTAKR